MTLQKENIPWNRGKKTGQIPHNKGKTKENYAPLKIVSEKSKVWFLTNEHPFQGKKRPEHSKWMKEHPRFFSLEERKRRSEISKRPEVRKKISLALKGKPKSKEHRKKLSELRKGKTWEELMGKEKAEQLKIKMSIYRKGKFTGKDSPNWGKHPSEETKEKMRKNSPRWWLGKHRSKEQILKITENTKKRIAGENNPMFGKHHSIEARQKISLATKKRLAKKENHPNWKGGISREPYSFDFSNELKELIRKRDNYSCQLCGTEQNGGKELAVHHIAYDKKCCDPQKLISLCDSCHSKTNYDREYWQELFFKKLNGI